MPKTSILVIGATGQLGTEIVRCGRRQGFTMKGLVRSPQRTGHLVETGCELLPGDLRDRKSLIAACEGADVVISTATCVFPRGRYSFEKDEAEGYENLIAACLEVGVSRLVFISNLADYSDENVAMVSTLRYKRHIENLLRTSGLNYTIVRAAPFMDDYFALMGSDIPLRQEDAATLHRPFWFSSLSVRLGSKLISNYKTAFCPGDPDARHAFIAISDVARASLEAAIQPELVNRTCELSGPESLSWRDIAELYGSLLEQPIRVIGVPEAVFAVSAKALERLSPAAANQAAILWLLARSQPQAEQWPGAVRPTIKASTYLHAKFTTPTA